MAENNNGSNECCCNDETLQETRNCLNCKNEWIRNLDHFERVSKCKEHRRNVAICSPGFKLCPTCTEEGYYVHVKGGSFCPDFEIRKKDENDDDE